MSPSGEHKKRRRFIVAAITANGLGATAGLAVQVLISDPTTSVLIGTVVSGTMGDVLLQVTRARNETSAPARTTEPGEVGDGARDGRQRPDEPGQHAHPGLGTVSGRARPGHGYARCTGHIRQEAGPMAEEQTGRQGIEVPRHPRHRHLHRAAQRRVQTKHTEPRALGSGNGAS